MIVKKGLGRGLGALIPTYDDDDEEEVVAPKKTYVQEELSAKKGDAVVELNIDDVIVNPNQPRKEFDQTKLEELAQSIKTHGVMQPIIVIKELDKYMIVAGERRYRASVIAKKETIPAIVRNYSAKQVKELALLENIQREDLNPMEIANTFNQLVFEYGFTQEDLAKRLGMQRSSIANYLRLLGMAPAVQEYVKNGKLSFGHAKVIAGIEDKNTQIEIANLAVKKQLSVRGLEQLIKELTSKTAKAKKQESVSTELKDLLKRMENCFGTKVSCLGNDKRGRIFIDYYSSEDLERIYEVLKILR